MACSPTKSWIGVMTESGKGEERKLNVGLAKKNQVTIGKRRLKKDRLTKDYYCFRWCRIQE
jgi:hypothetical protein